MKCLVAILLVGGVASAMSGCEVCACPPTPASALVYGTVRSSSGEVVPDARVRAYNAAAPGCNLDELAERVYDGVLSRSDGSFRMTLSSAGEQESVCVFVFALPPSGATGVVSSDTTLVVLDFRYEAPHDSARVDAVLKNPNFVGTVPGTNGAAP